MLSATISVKRRTGGFLRSRYCAVGEITNAHFLARFIKDTDPFYCSIDVYSWYPINHTSMLFLKKRCEYLLKHVEKSMKPKKNSCGLYAFSGRISDTSVCKQILPSGVRESDAGTYGKTYLNSVRSLIEIIDNALSDPEAIDNHAIFVNFSKR